MRANIFTSLLITLVVFTANVLGAEWQSDYEKALATAKAGNKCVLLNFTGSDWCGPCIEFKKVVFSKPEFTRYAEKNLVLVEIDYPRKKSLPKAIKIQNEQLKKQYGIEVKGFPTIVLLGPDGKTLGEFTGYDGQQPADMIAWLEKTRKS